MSNEMIANVLNWASGNALRSEALGMVLVGIVGGIVGWAAGETAEGLLTGAAIGVLAGLADSSYTQYNPYILGSSMLCSLGFIGYMFNDNRDGSKNPNNGTTREKANIAIFLAGFATFAATAACTGISWARS